MTSVQQHVQALQAGTVDLQTPLRSLLYIGPYIDQRLAANAPPLLTVGDLARYARTRNAQQINDALTRLCRNRRANQCVRDTGRGAARNGVTNQYHVRDVNLNAYNTLRNLLVAIRRHYAIFRRIPGNLRAAHVQRDAGTAICSCVVQAADCQQLEQQGECLWRNNRCFPRPRSRNVAFRGVDGFAGQHDSQGTRAPNTRYQRHYRIPDNR